MASTARKPGRATQDAESLWLVDPIDGTKAFVREYPMFSTQIALMRRGEIVLGVSSAPVYGELCFAERGCGAYLNGKRIGRQRSCRASRRQRCPAGNLKSLAGGAQWARYGALVARLNRIRGYGDFLHYHLLAGGKIDAVIETDVNILDIAACVAIVNEAGGTFHRPRRCADHARIHLGAGNQRAHARASAGGVELGSQA